MNRGRLYLLLSGLCMAGYAWVAWGCFYGISEDTGVCLFRAVTGIPCPSCGSTRSVISILHGDLAGSVHWNLLGFILLGAMIFLPVWIVSDVLLKKDTLFSSYLKAEQFLRIKWVAIPVIFLLAANWIWNIIRIT